jgi:hypothetical protein
MNRNIPGKNIFLILIMIPRLPSELEKANVPNIRKKTNPLIIKGACLNVSIGLRLKTFHERINRIRFSREAKTPVMLLISKNNGRYKNVNIFSGNG